MRMIAFGLLGNVIATLALMNIASLAAQDSPEAANDGTSSLIVGNPFSAIKFAHLVKVLPNGKRQFLRNEHLPVEIARDAEGRLMIKRVNRGDHPLPAECDHLEMPTPPPCPAWGVTVIDPVAHTVTHWPEGEMAFHGAVDYPLTPPRLDEAADSTSTMPDIDPDFSEEDGKIIKLDLGDRDIEGMSAHGVRWAQRYEANQDGRSVQRTRIHEVWTSAAMQLIIRVIDGDPNGEETVWGLMKISLLPDATLFRPPDGYEMEHRRTDNPAWSEGDFENLKTWFEK